MEAWKKLKIIYLACRDIQNEKWEDYFLKLSSDNHSNVMIPNSLEFVSFSLFLEKKKSRLETGSWWGKEEKV